MGPRRPGARVGAGAVDGLVQDGSRPRLAPMGSRGHRPVLPGRWAGRSWTQAGALGRRGRWTCGDSAKPSSFCVERSFHFDNHPYFFVVYQYGNSRTPRPGAGTGEDSGARAVHARAAASGLPARCLGRAFAGERAMTASWRSNGSGAGQHRDGRGAPAGLSSPPAAHPVRTPGAHTRCAHPVRTPGAHTRCAHPTQRAYPTA